MKIQFLGATQTVTGSKYLLTVGQKQVLVDCGLFQGVKALRQRNWEPFPFNPEKIDAVLITHAHIDHTGCLPLLVKRGFKGPIYATQATIDLCNILLRDSAYLQEEEALQCNAHGYSRHHPALPLYTLIDAELALSHFVPVEFGHAYSIVDNLTASWSRAGHILGSAFIRCQSDNIDLIFSGDMGRPHDPIMKQPAMIQSADYLVLESTYGDRTHDAENPMFALERIVNKTISRGGSVLIPAFAVGRAQTLLYYFNKLKKQNRLQSVPVYLDSPMATNATQIMAENAHEHTLSREESFDVCHVARYIQTAEDSRALNLDPTPKIIITASGMATGGRVLHHLKFFLPDAKNTVIFAGFQAEGTRGAYLIAGQKTVKIHAEEYVVNAEIIYLSNMSAHADADEILNWLRQFNRSPRHVYITHGELRASMSLLKRIETELGWSGSIPQYLDEETL